MRTVAETIENMTVYAKMSGVIVYAAIWIALWFC